MRKEGKTEKFFSDSGSRTPIPENHQKCSSSAGMGVRLESESVFGFVRNECSRSSGICTTYRDKFKGNIEEWLNGFMEDVLFKRHQFDLQAQIDHFKSVFDLIYEKAGDQAFTRFNEDGSSTGRLAPAYYEASVSAFSENEAAIRAMDAVTVIQKLQQAFSSNDFLQSTGPGANTIQKLRARIDAVSSSFKIP